MEKPKLDQRILPLLLTVFIDLLGVGIAIPTMVLLFVDPVRGILPFATSGATRNLLYGFLIALYPLAQFFGAPLLGELADRYGRKKMLLISLAGTLIGYLLFGYGITIKNVTLLFIGRMIDGFTGGNISIAYSAISDISTKENRARNFGLLGMMFGLGFVIGPYLGGKLSDPTVVSWFTFATPFWFTAILTAINLVQMTFQFKETLKEPIHREINLFTGFKNIAKVFQWKGLRSMFLVVFLLIFGWSFFTQFFQLYLYQKFHFTESQIGDLFAYVGVWIAFAQGFVTRVVSKRFEPAKVLSFSIFLLSIALIFLLVPQKSLYIYFVMPFIAIFQGLTMPNYTAIISNSADEHVQGEILGINQSVQALGQAIPPLIAGFAISFNVRLPIILASTISLVAGLLFIAFYHPANQTYSES